MTNTFNSYTKTILALFFLFVISASAAKAQGEIHEMSIPYNQDWEICDTPIAKYYRVGKLVTGSKSFFTGLIKDYYTDGHLQMQGTYDENGLKQGMFIYYHANGKVERRGNFVNNQMQGLWNYYNEKGDRFLAMLHEGADQFTPRFFINAKGDTTIENGTGRFEIAIDQYKHIFQSVAPVRIRYMSGSYVSGKKVGLWKYHVDHPNEQWDQLKNGNVAFDETYRDGELEQTRAYFAKGADHIVIPPQRMVGASSSKHGKIDNFSSDFAFQEPTGKWNNAYDYLFIDLAPAIISNSKSTDQNMRDYVRCIQKAVALTGGYNMVDTPYEGFKQGYWIMFNGIESLYENGAVPPSGDVNIRLKLSNAGDATDVRVEGNLSTELKKTITYYLSLLKNLHTDKSSLDTVVDLSLTIRNQPGNYKGSPAYSYYGMIKQAGIDYDFTKTIIVNGEIVAAIPPSCGVDDANWVSYLLKNDLFNHIEVSGNYLFEFVVNEDGTLSDIMPLRSSNWPSKEFEGALRGFITKSPKWTPATLQGKSIKYKKQFSFVLEATANERNFLFRWAEKI